jgi:hypothetical protein
VCGDGRRVGSAGCWIEPTPLGSIENSKIGHKEEVQEAMKSFTSLETFSLPWE